MQTKRKEMVITVVALFVALAMIGSASAFSTTPPKIPFEGVHLDVGEKVKFEADKPIAIDMSHEIKQRFTMQWTYGEYSNNNPFTITLNNTTSVDFKNLTDYDLPDIDVGAEITFEYPVDGYIKFIPKKITGDRPQIIISIDRADNSSDGMNVTISITFLKMYLGYTMEIDHSVNVTASLSTTTITIYIEHFSTQTLTAEGVGIPPDTSGMIAMTFIVVSAGLYIVFAYIHYKQSKELLKSERMDKIKKALFIIATIMLAFGIVQWVTPILYV